MIRSEANSSILWGIQKEFDMTTIIGILFAILLFFMCLAPLIAESGDADGIVLLRK
jgi:biopolymer transport protein ExbD